MVVGRRMLSKMTARQVKYVQPVFDPAPGSLTAAVYQQVEREMNLVIPPMLMHSPAPDALAAFWILMRETLNATGTSSRKDKEAVAAAVSVANICPYCVDMHTTGMYDLAGEHDAEAVGSDRFDEVSNPEMRDIARWARSAHVLDAPEHVHPALDPATLAELIGVVVTFHYLNRMVNVFLSDYLLPPRLRGNARRRLKLGLSKVLRPMLRMQTPPGEALALLPMAELPSDADWASGSPSVADAVARSSAAFEALGHEALPESVRDLVHAQLASWRGEEMGISRAWCEDAIAALPADDRAAGRLALLTAFASYQVDDHVVGEYRRWQPSDEIFIMATSWVSYTTARLIGARTAQAGAQAAAEQ